MATKVLFGKKAYRTKDDNPVLVHYLDFAFVVNVVFDAETHRLKVMLKLLGLGS